MDRKEKISRKIASMTRYVDFLKSYRSVSLERLKDDYLLRSAVERNFHLAIESALDIGEMIIASEGFERPEDYRSVIAILGRHHVIPADFAGRFAEAVGFRNILVHMYEEVDTARLHRYLQENLGDFDRFAAYIARYLASADEQAP